MTETIREEEPTVNMKLPNPISQSKDLELEEVVDLIKSIVEIKAEAEEYELDGGRRE